jgi:glycosyltransferase involved in cell wall biosynthesis
LPSQIILIDDASNDGSIEKIFALQKEYPLANISVEVMAVNGGPGLARNRGWELATEPWLAFLDADDAWHRKKLEISWDWIKLHAETVLLGHLTEQARADETYFPALPEPIYGESISFPKMLIANRFYTRTVMLKRDIPFRFQDRQYTEDYLLWLEIILSGRPGYVLNQPLALSFRPEFSAGGYSGQLWTHEKREMRAWIYLYQQNTISFLVLFIALPWSFIKYLRRALKGIFS